MSFSTAAISRLAAVPEGADWRVSWASSAPAGTPHQVYLDGRLVAVTTGTAVRLPAPEGRAWVEVGTVAAADVAADFAASLTPPWSARVRLDWQGGAFLGAVAEYRIYRSAAPGGAVDATAPVARVAPVAGLDGFGLGGFGAGGFGLAAAAYSWTSPPLAAGTWAWSVTAAHPGGAESAVASAAVAVAAPPSAPSAFADGTRLKASAVAGTVTLTWQAAT